jgi:hypothetical protein
MSEKELNAWAILIAVIKNIDRDYDIIENLLSDISDIKELIKTFD